MTDRAQQLVDEMTLEEQAELTAGADMSRTVANRRLGIPSVAVTDGPSGARGLVPTGRVAPPSLLLPCGSGLGATWDPELVSRAGRAIGRDARAKGCRVLLAPVLNLHRSPLAGRNYECYSEDPLLSGLLGAAFVRGAQSEGVVAAVKHLVGNETEFGRHTMSSAIDARTLREIYLLPFELAVKEGRALGMMTAYNRVNGSHVTENAELLRDVLREEWGFEGFVLTDWFGQASTVGSITAGLDLEMPGPARCYGSALAAAAKRGDIEPSLVTDAAGNLIRALGRVGALADDVAPADEDRLEDRALAREAAAASFVLLRNEGLLPLSPSVGRIAVIGSSAGRPQIMGGGPGAVEPHPQISPLEAIAERVGADVVVNHRGCDVDSIPPILDSELLRRRSGEPGLDVEMFAGMTHGEPAVLDASWPRAHALLLGPPAEELGADYTVRASATLVPLVSGTHTFTLVRAGRARLLLDDVVVLDGMGDGLPASDEFFGMAQGPIEARVPLTAAEPVHLVIELAVTGGFGGIRVGCRQPMADDDPLAAAAAMAAEADATVLVVGTTPDDETEGRDRTTLELPGEQDELVRRVLAATSNVVVVVNSGAPVSMDWADDASAVLQVWFAGQEMGPALADVLFGDAEPGGRLPLSIPARLEDTASFGNFPGEHGEVRYGEGLLVGYRWHDTRRLPARFAFGHGLSYTRFTIGGPRVSAQTFVTGTELTMEVDVTNIGTRSGSEVVQCYVAPRSPGSLRPTKELKAFAKVALEPGEQATVTLVLDDRSFSAWHPERNAWVVDGTEFDLLIGRSSVDIAHVLTVDVASSG